MLFHPAKCRPDGLQQSLCTPHPCRDRSPIATAPSHDRDRSLHMQSWPHPRLPFAHRPYRKTCLPYPPPCAKPYPCPVPRSLVQILRTDVPPRSEEHTSELQSLMRISYAVFCLKKTTIQHITN